MKILFSRFIQRGKAEGNPFESIFSNILSLTERRGSGIRFERTLSLDNEVRDHLFADRMRRESWDNHLELLRAESEELIHEIAD